MVNPGVSLTGNGLRDWIIQRVTALILAAYVIWLVAYLICAAPIDFVAWHSAFESIFAKVFTVLALLSLVLHAWIGMWTVLTDYVKPKCIQLPLMVAIIIALFGYCIWGIYIVWGA